MSQSRTAVVTGAAGGLGRAFALAFADRGDGVVVADRDTAGAQATASLISERGGRALSIDVDVTDRKSTDAMAAVAAEFGRGGVDIVVNNAAIYATLNRSPLEEIADAEWDAVMAVNLKGPWQVVRALSPHLRSGASVVNLSSATVMSGSAQWAHYVASKGGVIALTRVMAKELGARDITVNAVAPGFTLTQASIDLMDDAASYGVDRGCLKRASQPEDIVGAVLFLTAPDSSYITGQTLVVDGGRQFI
jgi:NAD(P)-dependent dehydrogenase (short-subunit alcohol dehydrogenase family)